MDPMTAPLPEPTVIPSDPVDVESVPSRLLLIVRHARAIPKDGWTGADADRPLTVAGVRQAAAFADVMIGDLPIRRVLTSPTRRCEQTAAPLVAARRLPLLRCAALGIGGSVRALLELLASEEADGAVLCTHGERIRELFEAWHAQGRRGLPSSGGRTRKGDAWLLRGYPAEDATVEYLATPDRPRSRR